MTASSLTTPLLNQFQQNTGTILKECVALGGLSYLPALFSLSHLYNCFSLLL